MATKKKHQRAHAASASSPQPLTMAQTCSLTGMSRFSLLRWAEVGHFPKPRRMGVGTTGRLFFFRHEVEEWLLARPVVGGVAR